MRCNGEQQDDTGAWYCPRDPDLDASEYDCEECHRAEQEVVDRYVKMREEEEDEKGAWG